MGRTVDSDVHAAFVEFRAKDDDKCLSVQCIYCQQIRAKNTSRQKQHLQECPGLRNTNAPPPQPQPQPSPQNAIQAPNGYGTPQGPGQAAMVTQNAPLMNGVPPHGTPLQNVPSIPNRPPLPSQATPSAPTATPVPRPPAPAPPPPQKTPKSTQKPTPSSSLPQLPLDDVHAAFVEFRAKDEDKCLSVQCLYCNQIRAKNTSRQRQHLSECQTYQNVIRDSIPANNLQHTFPEGDIARSLQLPQPNLELDFRISVRLNPKLSLGPGVWGQRNWISFVGGNWAGRFGKGIVIPGGQDSQLVVKDLATRVEAQYLLQTHDEPPAYIAVKTSGWRTGSRDVLEKLADAVQADGVNPNSYKFRIFIELETGDERYSFVNTCMWIGSGCRRANEVVYDAYRVA
ncbi:MAG: hypothetical protein Q9227_007149 [Pyrenula ochraceoflavens]